MIPPIVSPDWVLARRSDAASGHRSDLVLADVRHYLDGRSGLTAYGAAHIAGAVFVDLDADLSDHEAPLELGRHPFPDPDSFATAMGRLGIGDDTTVVAYDDSGGGSAARLVWMLRVIGHDAALLDGGLHAWPEPLVASAPPDSDPARFTPVAWPPARFVDAAEVFAAVERGATLLDARAPDRYRGEHEPIDARAGHIPGARNAPWVENLASDGRFASIDELRSRYADHEPDHGAEIVCYCGSGVTACVDLLALEHAGYTGGRLYAPSWSGWSSDPERPAEFGAS